MASDRAEGGRAASLVAPIAAGLGASTILLVDYLRPAPVFCGPGGGCEALRHSAFAGVLGLPTPAVAAPPLLAPRAARPEVPPPIAAELARTPPHQITVVDFTDFECPFCRASHAVLAPILARNAARVRVVRKHVPLTWIHPHALA